MSNAHQSQSALRQKNVESLYATEHAHKFACSAPMERGLEQIQTR